MVNEGPKHNDAADTYQGGTTVCGQTEVMNNENATVVTNDGECPTEEEKNEETTLEEEKNNAEHIMEEAEKNEANGLEEEDNKQHETGEEEEAREGEEEEEQEREKEEKKKKEIEQKKNAEKVVSNSNEKGKRSRKRGRKEAQRGSKTTEDAGEAEEEEAREGEEEEEQEREKEEKKKKEIEQKKNAEKVVSNSNEKGKRSRKRDRKEAQKGSKTTEDAGEAEEEEEEQERGKEEKKEKEIEQKRNTKKVGSNSKEKGERSRNQDRKEARRGSKTSEDAGEEEEEEEEQGRGKEGKKEKELEQKKNTEKVGSHSKEKGERSRNRDRKKVARRGSKATELEDKTGSSHKKKRSKRAESMGMIFMCNSKTKKDCYRYRVLGLPANKRDTVEKVYKGMRLFLFDVDLRLMYGIYKAAGPGGYNIEPEAFKSAFPSQVRFSILEDCLPLAEEKFKAVIKENYFTRNKFDCQLSSQQVKKLCKLFLAASKGSTSRRALRDLRADRDRVRRRGLDKERRSPPLSDRGYHDHPTNYEREAYPSTVASLPPRYQPLPLPPASVPSYASYGRTLEVDVYGRDILVERRDHRLAYVDPRHQDEIISRDPYNSYREPPPYREPVSSVGRLAEYDPPGLRPEYRSVSDLPQHALRYSAAVPSEYDRPLYPY